MDPFYQSLQTSRDVVAFPDAVFLYRNQRMIVKFRFENLNLNLEGEIILDLLNFIDKLSRKV